MIDTREAGAGSYPEPPEPNNKCYNFKALATIELTGYVYAENEDAAKELINNRDYEEDEIRVIEIDDIEEIEVD